MRPSERHALHPIHLAIAFSALTCATCAGLLLAVRSPRRPPIAAALGVAALGLWACAQLFYLLEPDPERALWIARISTAGLLVQGPLALRVFAPGNSLQRLWQQRTRHLEVATGVVFAASLATPWMIAELHPAPWGYTLGPGPLFPLTMLVPLGAITTAIWLRAPSRDRVSELDQRGRRLALAVIVLLPTSVALTADLLLPMAGGRLPPLTPAVFGPLALVILGTRLSTGFSYLSPDQVAEEILQILPDGVALVSEDDRILLVNDELARLYEVPPAELAGRPLAELLRETGELEGPGAERDAELILPAGGSIPVSLREAHHLGRANEAMGRVLVMRDVRELSQLRRQVVVSARLAAVGELAAGIAHEINNPLAFVRANLAHLESSWKQLRPVVVERQEPELRELLGDCDELIEESIEGVDRAAEIVRGVRNFAHAGSTDREETDLRPLLEEVLKVASGKLRDHANVMREFEPDLPPVIGSPQQLKQVFLNLVINAAQAVDAEGSVLVATRRDGDSVVVSVADDGCGIPKEHLDRLFDPFFTTKPVGEGTGLGLGISHQIVQRHEGEIEVESEPGAGSVFRVRLPAALSATR